jgi:REP element-mobilizing transposase RayT
MTKRRYHPRSARLWKLGSKCVDDQFLLTPTPDVCALVCLFLAKMQELYDVKVVAVVFMGNHFHLLLLVREARLPGVMRHFKGGLAKALNKLHGRRGALWMERYDDDAVLDYAATETAIHYFHANPVRAHLVQKADDYVGVSSWKAYSEDTDSITHTTFDERAFRRAGSPESLRGLYARTITVKIARPPSWDGLSTSERRARVRALRSNMCEEEKQASAERARTGGVVPSTEELVAREPRSRPTNPKPKRAKRRRASGSDELVKRFHAAYDQILPAYEAASRAFRETGILPPFPEGTYPPRIMYAFVES